MTAKSVLVFRCEACDEEVKIRTSAPIDVKRAHGFGCEGSLTFVDYEWKFRGVDPTKRLGVLGPDALGGSLRGLEER